MNLAQSIRIPLLLIGLFWIIKLIEHYFGYDFVFLGIYPQSPSGLIGILLAPFLHGNFAHLMSNSPSFFVLMASVLFFYPKIARKVILMIYLCSGLGVWLFARNAYHIGASGLIYGFASFLFFSGIFRKNVQSLTISLGVALVYGGMLYGLIPNSPHISWESHLIGAACGVAAAYYFSAENIDGDLNQRKENPSNEFEGYINIESDQFKYEYRE